MKRKKLLPAPVLILLDVLAIALCLNIYALFHHVLIGDLSQVGGRGGRPAGTMSVIPTPKPADTPAPAAEIAAEETPLPTEELPVVDEGQFGEKFRDLFAEEGEIIQTETLYVSHDLRLELSEQRAFRSDVHIVDVYIRNIENFRTTFAGGADAYDGQRATVQEMALRENAVAAINGDFCGFIAGGEYVVLRNGVYFYDQPTRAVCVLYYDGSLRTFWKPNNQTGDDFDLDEAMAQGAWQIWSFGPALLDEEGHANALYDDPARPRTVLGYYEPGHYALIMVEGRSDRNLGMTLTELAQFAESLGLTQGFNLDGGQSSTLMFDGRLVAIGSPSEGLREVSDMIYIVERDGTDPRFADGGGEP